MKYTDFEAIMSAESHVQRSLREAKMGDIIHYDTLDDLIKEIG